VILIDSSVLLAILLREPEADQFVTKIRQSEAAMISGPTYLESAIACVSKFGPVGEEKLRDLVFTLGIKTIGFSEDATAIAVSAFLRYGKGRGHPAQLNFGDCIAYATSKVEAMPLLFKGEDFRLTDVECVL
jgi:ribonuclease VapC